MTPKGNLNLEFKSREVQVELIKSNFTPKQASGDKERKHMMPNSVKNIEGKKIVFDPALFNIASKPNASLIGPPPPHSTYGNIGEKQKLSPTSKVTAPATTPNEPVLLPPSSKFGAKKAKFGVAEAKKNLQLNIDEINKENPFGGEMCEKPAK